VMFAQIVVREQQRCGQVTNHVMSVRCPGDQSIDHVGVATGSDVYDHITRLAPFEYQIFSTSPSDTIVSIVVRAAQLGALVLMFQKMLDTSHVLTLQGFFEQFEIASVYRVLPTRQIIVSIRVVSVFQPHFERINHLSCHAQA
jgi:hypothetical protein